MQLDAFRGQRITLGVVGSVLTVWAGLGVFGAITTAMNYAWRVEKQPNYFKHKLVSFLMMAAAGALTFLGLVFVSAQGVARATWFATSLEGRPAFTWLTGLAASSATTVLFVFVVGLIFYFVPNTNVRFRDVWLGRAAHRPAVEAGPGGVLVLRPRPLTLLHPRIDRGGHRLPGLGLSLVGHLDLRRRSTPPPTRGCAPSIARRRSLTHIRGPAGRAFLTSACCRASGGGRKRNLG